LAFWRAECRSAYFGQAKRESAEKTSQNEFFGVIRTPKATPTRNRREAEIRALREEISANETYRKKENLPLCVPICQRCPNRSSMLIFTIVLAKDWYWCGFGGIQDRFDLKNHAAK
jgi:hypothetical protein